MYYTKITSAKKEVVIGRGLPTVIIGERINPTGRKKLRETLLAGDLSLVLEEARAQVAAGAAMLDVNVGVAGLDEVKMLPLAVQAVSEVVDVPLCLDSSFPDALEAALSVYKGKALVNSVTGEESSLARVLPVVKKYGAAVVGLCMDENGVPGDVAGRVAVARKIVAAAEEWGIPREDVVLDCVTMTVGTDHTAARVTLDVVRQVAGELGVNVTLGASNISHGLPDRGVINRVFLATAVMAGATALIMDPLVPGNRRLVKAADLLMGHDEWAAAYLDDYRSFPE